VNVLWIGSGWGEAAKVAEAEAERRGLRVEYDRRLMEGLIDEA